MGARGYITHLNKDNSAYVKLYKHRREIDTKIKKNEYEIIVPRGAEHE